MKWYHFKKKICFTFCCQHRRKRQGKIWPKPLAGSHCEMKSLKKKKQINDVRFLAVIWPFSSPSGTSFKDGISTLCAAILILLCHSTTWPLAQLNEGGNMLIWGSPSTFVGGTWAVWHHTAQKIDRDCFWGLKKEGMDFYNCWEPKRAHVTPLYLLALAPDCSSHQVQTLTLAYRTTTGSAPAYFHSLLLVVPSHRSSKSLSRTFSFIIPGCWNDLTPPIRNAGSLSIFMQKLISFNTTWLHPKFI